MLFAKIFGKKRVSAPVSSERTSIASESSSLASAAAAGGGFDEEEIAAVIAAAIQAYSVSNPGCSLVIKSIKRTGSSVPVWCRTGRLERLARKM